MRFSSLFGSGDSQNIIEALSKTLIMIEMELDGTIRHANDIFFDMFDHDPKTLPGRPHASIQEPEFACSAAYREIFENVRKGEFQWTEMKRVNKTGDFVFLQVWYYPILGKNGRPYKIVEISADVTYDKMKLLEVESQIEAINRVQAYIEFLPDGTILTANENFVACMGFGLDEIVGRHHRMFVDPVLASGAAYRQHWQTLHDGQPVTGEFARVAKCGRQVHLSGIYSPVLDISGNVTKIVKYASEVTGRVHAVQSIGKGLRQLAEGDLRQRISDPFTPEMEKLRVDFNASLDVLENVIDKVAETAISIESATSEISQATEDLSRRTEQQAVSIEETAATLEDIAQSVKQSTARAVHAGDLVTHASGEAKSSNAVVARTVTAMSQIETSSKEIVAIIGMIDDIAFQTSLLALNAGVEAARAGEAGRGFAVVAQEVRHLAQRSADAARDVKRLIHQSGDQIKEGVTLGAETGRILTAISTEVGEIDTHVSAIVATAHSQENGLAEISRNVRSIDQNTQQNAAMVEQSAAACANLALEASELSALLSSFGFARSNAAGASTAKPGARAASAPRKTAPVRSTNPAIRIAAPAIDGGSRHAASPARTLVDTLHTAFSGNPARAPAPSGDDWTEF
ncbi:PAS domain-containing methyl-accepting chemotaxis protein [Fulvimarina sp. 2208YS6-2-32]|uniref:PAS domain-containing methyl-accepting chemotaxis protein n=1 Tax=Fulvimarina uroteuthidis TaxID=3098149 RepID=A0ABU5HXA5_9HYPH|nr:PAS domain-containing methyl-accepting chemotaxis protein [Fulvimarina sp. 2208YS6-2-32]MDY8107774.1 PAS domain-containing methyl-accepting chemotaxis protein [Fulvimarina sp. 2208YS6-2-32]